MPIEKLLKGSDALFNIIFTDGNGDVFKVSDLDTFTIRFFTTDDTIYTEYNYQSGIYNGIVDNDGTDCIVINSNDLLPLDEGVIKYVYHIKTKNLVFKDSLYDERVTGQTNIYLKSNLNCNGNI